MTQIATFIDGGYIDKILRNEFNYARISYERLQTAICQTIDPAGRPFRTYYYHCLPYKSTPPTQEESQRFASAQNFIEALNHLPRFEVRLGKLARRGPDAQGDYNYEQKMVDVLFSIDIVLLAAKNQVTDIAILAGDSDFVPAVEIAKREGVSIWLFHGSSFHDTLWTLADERIRIEQSLIDQVRWHP